MEVKEIIKIIMHCNHLVISVLTPIFFVLIYFASQGFNLLLVILIVLTALYFVSELKEPSQTKEKNKCHQ